MKTLKIEHHKQRLQDYYGFNNSKATEKSEQNFTFKQLQSQNSNRSHNAHAASTHTGLRGSSAARNDRKYSNTGSARKEESLASSKLKEGMERDYGGGNNSDLKKEMLFLRREIEKLERESMRKDQQILEMRKSMVPSNESQFELLQVYRCLHYYQGKVKEMESEISRYRDFIANSENGTLSKDGVRILFDELRRDNEELHAIVEETEFLRWTMQNKYHKMEAKYFETHRELIEAKRKENNPLANFDQAITQNLSTPHLNRVVAEVLTSPKNKNKQIPACMEMEVKQRQALLRDAEEKLTLELGIVQKELEATNRELVRIIGELEEVKVENKRLKNEKERKDEELQELFKKYALARKRVRELEGSVKSLRREESFSQQVSHSLKNV